MTLTRRHFLASCSALAAAVPTARAWSATRLDLGSVQIDTLSDGHLVLPVDFLLLDRPEEEAVAILARHGLRTDQLEQPCNLTLLRDGTNTVLFDAGSGDGFMPTAGALPDSLDALDLTPEDITHVVFTHGHPDHLWGVLDDFDDPLFPGATHMIGKTEFEYWMNPATVDTIGEARASFAVGAKRRLEAISEQLETFQNGQEILTGITALASPGHTPGHMGFAVQDGSNSAMIVGDAIVNGHIAFEHPGLRAGSDQDPDLAAKTRLALLDQLATDKMQLIGFHLPEGGIGRAERQGNAYRFITGEN